MRRSQINDILERAKAFIDQHQVHLPPFAHLAPAELANLAGTDVIANGLGWDVTDYGLGKFDEMGLFLFTLRNGTLADLERGRGMVYAEKLLISRQDQLSPMHTHVIKSEDIIKAFRTPPEKRRRLVGVLDRNPRSG